MRTEYSDVSKGVLVANYSTKHDSWVAYTLTMAVVDRKDRALCTLPREPSS